MTGAPVDRPPVRRPSGGESGGEVSVVSVVSTLVASVLVLAVSVSVAVQALGGPPVGAMLGVAVAILAVGVVVSWLWMLWRAWVVVRPSGGEGEEATP